MCVTGWTGAQEPFHDQKSVLVVDGQTFSVDGQTCVVLVLLVKLTSLFAALRLRQNKSSKIVPTDSLST